MIDCRHFLLSLPGIQLVLLWRADMHARWFDWRHGIRTSGDVQPEKMRVTGKNLAYGRKYNPTALRSGKRVFEELPINDFSQYTFIDFGSGKGRMLFLASEYPFRRIMGVEYAADLHDIAEQNIRSYRNPRQRCFELVSLNVDAADFAFPLENTVLYFYSPFNRPLMEPLFRRLDESVGAHPRDVVIVYMNPELSDIIENTKHFKTILRGPYYSIYRTIQE